MNQRPKQRVQYSRVIAGDTPGSRHQQRVKKKCWLVQTDGWKMRQFILIGKTANWNVGYLSLQRRV